MKALTIRQPWASLIAAGVKTIETRSWSTKYRGPLAIHAGLSFHPFDDAYARLVSAGVAPMDGLVACSSRRTDIVPRGAVVATCTLTDVVPMVDERPSLIPGPQLVIYGDDRERLDMAHPVHLATRSGLGRTTEVSDQLPFGDFAPGRYAWLLTDITPCDPIPVKGRQGLWNWEAPA